MLWKVNLAFQNILYFETEVVHDNAWKYILKLKRGHHGRTTTNLSVR
jgi:hypothetical protein